MRTLLPVALLALALPTPALAGMGTTFYLGAEDANNGFLWGGYYPSLDIVTPKVDVQIHVFEFLRRLTQDDFYLGANAYLPIVNMDISGKVTGTVHPGLSVDLSGEPFELGVAGLVRIGAESEGRMGAGIYVVPALGFAVVDDDIDLLLGGTLQFSAWIPRFKG